MAGLDPMSMLAGGAVSGLGSAISGIAGYYSAKQAREAQERAVAQGRTDVTDAYNKAQSYQQPYATGGAQDYQTLRDKVNSGAYNMAPQTYTDSGFNYNQNSDPGTQFRMQQGTNAINTSAAASGGGLSGATLKALSKYGSDLGSQEYQNAYNRYNTNRNFGYQNFTDSYNRQASEMGNQYNRAANLSNIGVGAANNLSNQATNYGSQMGNLAVQQGNAQSAGIMAQGNAIGNIGQNIGSIAPYIMASNYNNPNTLMGGAGAMSGVR